MFTKDVKLPKRDILPGCGRWYSLKVPRFTLLQLRFWSRIVSLRHERQGTVGSRKKGTLRKIDMTSDYSIKAVSMYAPVAYLDKKLDKTCYYADLSPNKQVQWSSDQSETDTVGSQRGREESMEEESIETENWKKSDWLKLKKEKTHESITLDRFFDILGRHSLKILWELLFLGASRLFWTWGHQKSP